MYRIESDLYRFVEAIRSRQTILLQPDGQWCEENSWKNWFYRLVGVKECNMNVLAQAFIECLDRLEHIPVRFNATSNGDGAIPQAVDFHAYLIAAKALEEALSTSSSVKSINLLQQLHRRIIALRYRLERVNGGLDQTSGGNDLHLDLKQIAAEWKKKQTVFIDHTLTAQDIEKLQQACRYQAFTELLLKNVNLQESFFTCILRDQNGVAPFVEFPAMQERINVCNLQSRIGRLGGEALNIVKTEPESSRAVRWVEKQLTLPFEGKSHSILDNESVVHFRGHYELTIHQIFEIFRLKDQDIGNLEFMADGIINWNPYRMASWDAQHKAYQQIDMNQSNWWNQLPHFETITAEEGHARYGSALDGENWVVAATATRTSPNLDFENTHAFFEVAIPIGEHKYQVYHFGKFGIYMMATLREQMAGFCETVPAVISYPDLNVFYTHRQLTHCPFLLTPQKGNEFMDALKVDIIKGHEGNFVYQVESENCAKWTHEILVSVIGTELVPNLYRMPLLETHPTGLVGRIFRFVKTLPKKIQVRTLTSLHLLFGAWRGTWITENGSKVWKSMLQHEFWDTAEVYLPALLVEQRINGTLAFVVVKDQEEGTHVERPPIMNPWRTLYPILARTGEMFSVEISDEKQDEQEKQEEQSVRRRGPGLLGARVRQILQGLFVSNQDCNLICSAA